MSYKPKFCCQCGEEIERTEWKLWNSRRFCPLCETEFGVYDWITRLLVAGGVLFGIIGFGSYLQKTNEPLNIARNQTAVAALPYANKSAANQAAARQSANQIVQDLTTVQPNNSPPTSKSRNLRAAQDFLAKKSDNASVAVQEAVYYCGAQTKKGTMCSHRVKGGGRCWQHVGQPAMLPQEKLIASQ